MLYIFWFLHQTTTLWGHLTYSICCISFDSYIKPQHNSLGGAVIECCISFDSYIKPQLVKNRTKSTQVVYLLIPTSNHNQKANIEADTWLYIFWFLHQTTTLPTRWYMAGTLYIFWFLHQTTTVFPLNFVSYGCISFDSYIKPQLFSPSYDATMVVYLLIPTSNHNFACVVPESRAVVYLLIPTSNHNRILVV